MSEISQSQVYQFSNTEYRKRLFDWYFIRDAIEGESAIKFKNELYLPMPTSMADFPPAVSSQSGYYSQFWSDDLLKTLMMDLNPNFHRNPAYSAYLSRAEFPELPGYVLRGLLGLALKELPTVKLPKGMEFIEENATSHGFSLVEYFAFLLQETLSQGRVITTFDVTADSQFIFAAYKTEDCLNWKYQQSRGTDKKLEGLRLVEVQADEFDDSYVSQTTMDKDCTIVEMKLINGQYMVRHADEEEELTQDWIQIDEAGDLYVSHSVKAPSYRGKTFDFIPAIAIGSLNNEFDIDPSPMYPIANAARQIYMKSADLSQSEYLSCSPMLVLTGVQQDSAPKAVGSTVSLAIPNPEAKVYYTKTDTSALSHVKDHIEKLFTRAIQSGAQLLDTSPKPAETAETTRLKQSASTATLLTCIRNVSNALEKQLKQIAVLMDLDPEEVAFVPNIEFIAPAITAAEIRELVQSWVNGALSHRTVLSNFKKAGLIDESLTIDEELQQILKEEADLQPGSAKYNRLKALFERDRGGLGKDRVDMSVEDSAPETTVED